jgi:DNA-binding response OmpR family regulator
MKILLAEDGHDHARILLAVLSKHGFEVTWLETGTDAYDYLVANPAPDLLITDIMMPGMSGFELIARLKAEGRMPPTIVLTGKQREEDILRGLEYGVLDYIIKPFSPSVLLAKVRNAIGRKAA